MGDMSEDPLHNFGVESILTDEEVDERPIFTWPIGNILTTNCAYSTKCWGPTSIKTWKLLNQ